MVALIDALNELDEAAAVFEAVWRREVARATIDRVDLAGVMLAALDASRRVHLLGEMFVSPGEQVR